MTIRRCTTGFAATLIALLAATLPAGATAQAGTPADRAPRPTGARPRGRAAPRPTAPVADSAQIRAQAATPQLITVRPRQPLTFDAQLVVPTFYDRSFWPSIFAPYSVVLPPAAGTAVDSPAGVPAESTAAGAAGPVRRQTRPGTQRTPRAARAPTVPR